MTPRWSNERAALLKELSVTALSLRQLADRMTRLLGIRHTRDAVRGQLRQLGITRQKGRQTENKPAPERREPVVQTQAKEPSAPKVPSAAGESLIVKAPPETCRPVRYRACQYPLGEPSRKAFRLCGDPAMPGKPYCKLPEVIDENDALVARRNRHRRSNAR
jgi:GcrA cell cycle regulator